jgi:cyclic pyranopterin phosphate synthase
LESCKVDWAWEELALRCTVTVSAHYRTGIEMEALTGVSAGLLCALDMVKSFEKDENGQYPTTRISDILVLEKHKAE